MIDEGAGIVDWLLMPASGPEFHNGVAVGLRVGMCSSSPILKKRLNVCSPLSLIA
jgi:hypothetical protein